MSVANKLFGMWAVSKTVSTATPILIHLLADMAAIAIYVLVSALITTMFIAGVVWLAYTEMVASGLAPQTAALIVGSLLLAALAALVLTAKNRYRRLYTLSSKALRVQPPVMRTITTIMDAFWDGLESGNPM